MEEDKTGWGIAICVIIVMGGLVLLQQNVFSNRRSIAHLLVTCCAVEFWAGVLVVASTHPQKSFLFRLLVILFHGKERLYFIGMLSVIGGVMLFPLFFIFGWI